jgi:6-phosphogluconate dehydrogenase
MKQVIDLETECRLRRISENLWLNFKEKEKLIEIYNNSSSEMRDIIVSELEQESRSKNLEVRYNLRDKLRKL